MAKVKFKNKTGRNINIRVQYTYGLEVVTFLNILPNQNTPQVPIPTGEKRSYCWTDDLENNLSKGCGYPKIINITKDTTIELSSAGDTPLEDGRRTTKRRPASTSTRKKASTSTRKKASTSTRKKASTSTRKKA